MPGPDDVLPIFNGEDGDLMKAMPTPFSLRLQRSKLQKLLATGIDIHVRHLTTSQFTLD